MHTGPVRKVATLADEEPISLTYGGAVQLIEGDPVENENTAEAGKCMQHKNTNAKEPTCSRFFSRLISSWNSRSMASLGSCVQGPGEGKGGGEYLSE